MEGEVWSVKKEKLFERSEFFSFSGMPDWNSSKSADGSLSFLLPFSFCCQKEKSKDSIHKTKNLNLAKLNLLHILIKLLIERMLGKRRSIP